MLSVGTALASLPWQRVWRRCSQSTVLVDLPYSSTAGSSDTCYSRRTRNTTTAFASHEENWFVFSRSQRPPLTRTSVVVQRYFLITTKLLISNPIPAKEITKTPAGTVARVRPHRTI